MTRTIVASEGPSPASAPKGADLGAEPLGAVRSSCLARMPVALIAAGFEVAVVCPKAPGDPSYRRLDGVDLFKYRPYAPGGSSVSFVIEYALLLLRHSLAQPEGELARSIRRSSRAATRPICSGRSASCSVCCTGPQFVFDHHDLCPELYQSRFPDGSRLVYRALRLMERRTMRTADHVISTNDSYRQIVLERDGVARAGRDSRTDRARPDPSPSHRGRPEPPAGQTASRCVPRCDGTTGWRGPRSGGGGSCRAPTWSQRHQLHSDRIRRLLR